MDKSPITLRHSRNNQVEDLMTQWRVHWEYVAAYPLDDIKFINGQQVRAQDHRAPADSVREYAEQARNGAPFPPIVLARDNDGQHSMIDGNTRYQMARLLDQTAYPVYIANVTSMDYAKSLGAALNQIGGRRLTEREALEAVLSMLGENVNFTDVEISQAVGIPASRVAIWRKEYRTEQRAKTLGVAEQVEKLTPMQRKELTRIKLDEPFKATVDLLTSRRVRRDDLKDLMSEITEATTEEAQLAAIAEFAASLPVGGPNGEATIVNQKARRMRMLLPQMLNLSPAEEMYEAERAVEDERAWRNLQRIVTDMLAMYALHGISSHE